MGHFQGNKVHRQTMTHNSQLVVCGSCSKAHGRAHAVSVSLPTLYSIVKLLGEIRQPPVLCGFSLSQRHVTERKRSLSCLSCRHCHQMQM